MHLYSDERFIIVSNPSRVVLLSSTMAILIMTCPFPAAGETRRLPPALARFEFGTCRPVSPFVDAFPKVRPFREFRRSMRSRLHCQRCESPTDCPRLQC